MPKYVIKEIYEKKLNIDSPIWKQANVANINIINWENYVYCPSTKGFILHNQDGFFVKFTTDEYPIVTNCKNLNEDVYMDSCVEFFFKPNPEDPNYFNFEINPLGTFLIGYGSGRGKLRTRLNVDISIFDIETKIIENRGWEVKYYIPFSFILEYANEIKKEITGNLQKCAENGEHPHFVTFNRINTEKPDFHQSSFFDKFIISNLG